MQVIQLNHPETGCLVNACFQPWTSLSGILTIMKPLFSGKDITKYLGTQSMRDQLKLLQGLIKNIQAKLDTARNNLDEKCSVDTGELFLCDFSEGNVYFLCEVFLMELECLIL